MTISEGLPFAASFASGDVSVTVRLENGETLELGSDERIEFSLRSRYAIGVDSSADTATVVRGDSTYVLFSRAAGASDDRDTEICWRGDVLSRRAIAVAGGVADRVTGDAGNDVITLRGSSVTRRIDGGSDAM